MRKSVIGMIRTVTITALVTAAVMLVLLYAPSPFVVTKPGIAVTTDPYIQLVDEGQNKLEQADKLEGNNETNSDSIHGQFLLTAILLEAPSIWRSLGSLFEPGHDVKLKYEVLGGASIQQYAETVSTMMQGSHINAIEAAYRHLGIAYSIEPQYVVVQQTKGHVGASSMLEAGDKLNAVITHPEQKREITSIEQLATIVREQLVTHQASADHRKLVLLVERKGRQLELDIEMDRLDSKLSNEQLIADALDVASFVEMRAIEPSEDKFKVEILVDNIGGPSAGLAFSLTIIDKLTEGDLTRGKNIAVTGTIEPTGRVGLIGGIKQKVHTTSKRGADLFIVPKGNEKEATRTLKSLKSSMRIVGVSNLEEAIELIASM